MKHLNEIELTIRRKTGGGAIKKIMKIDFSGTDFQIINQAKLKWLNDYISRDNVRPVNFISLADANKVVKNAFNIQGKIISKNY